MSSFLNKRAPREMFGYYIIGVIVLMIVSLIGGTYDSHEREKNWHIFEVTNHCRVVRHSEPTVLTTGSRTVLVPERTTYACDGGFYEERNDDK